MKVIKEAKPENEFSIVLRILIFIKERFPLLQYLPLILVFYYTNAMLSATSEGIKFIYLSFKVFASFFVTLLIFFHLRLFDEIKDIDTDILAHPNRPLARGLISIKEAQIISVFVLLLEIILSYYISRNSLIGISFVIFYSILMYKEFFISQWLKPRPVIYALVHAPVSPLISLFIFSSTTGNIPIQLNLAFAIFLLSIYFVSNVFEFSRKIFLDNEEEEYRDSYSKIFGPIVASWLVFFYITIALLCALITAYILNFSIIFYILIGLLFIISFVISIIFHLKQNILWVSIVRGNGSIFILFYNIVIIIGILIR